mgnify:CR=1 FL=1
MKSGSAAAMTPWSFKVRIGGIVQNAGTAEVYDLGRALAGALFVSLPLLFTEEMWNIAKTIGGTTLLLFFLGAVVINRMLLSQSGYRRERWQPSLWWDTIVVMGVGIVASAATLFVSGIINAELNTYLIGKTILLEAIPTSMGAAVALNQLGGGDRLQDEGTSNPDIRMLVGTVLGAYLFAFNVAPTAETGTVVAGQAWWQVALTSVLSVAISYMVIAVAHADDQEIETRSIVSSEWFEAVLSYLVAFAVSLGFLWAFGYADPFDRLDQWVPQTIVLAYATTLGGAAGRLVL